MRRDDPNTWTIERYGIAETFTGTPYRDAYTPRLCSAFDQLMGTGKWEESNFGLGWWVVSFPGFWDDALEDDPTLEWGAAGSWHVDGAHFQHHIDSKEVGLLPIFLFSEIGSHDGGTLLCPGSHHVVARILHEHRLQGGVEGMRGTDVSAEAIARCGDANGIIQHWVEVQGSPGDVVLCHPFMLHARSMNCGRALGRSVRPMCHPAISLKEDMNVLTPNATLSSLSIVERTIQEAIVDATQ